MLLSVLQCLYETTMVAKQANDAKDS